MAIKGFRMKSGTNMQNSARVEFYARCPKHPKRFLWVWHPDEIVQHGGDCAVCGDDPRLVGVAIAPRQETCDTLVIARCQLAAFEGMVASACDRGAISKDVAVAHIKHSKSVRRRIARVLRQGA